MKYPAAELRGILAYFDKYESLLPLPDGEKVEVRLDHFKYLWLDLIGIWLLEFNSMDVILSTERVDLQECDLLVTGFFEDERPLKGSSGWVDWRLNGLLSNFLIEKRLNGDWKEMTLIPSQGRMAPRMTLLLGLGKTKEYSYLRLREICSYLLETLRRLRAQNVCLSFPYEESFNVDCGKLVEVLIEGIVDCLDSNRYPSNEEGIKGLRLFFAEGEERFSEILLGVQTAKSILGDRLKIRIFAPSEENANSENPGISSP